jgi:hypothetical protein
MFQEMSTVNIVLVMFLIQEGSSGIQDLVFKGDLFFFLISLQN